MPTLCYAPFSDLLCDRFCSDAKPWLGCKSYKNSFLHVSGQLYDHQVSYKFSVAKWTWSGIRKKFLVLYENQICSIFSLNSLEIEDVGNIFPLAYRIMSCCLLEIKNQFLPRLLHQSKINVTDHYLTWPMPLLENLELLLPDKSAMSQLTFDLLVSCRITLLPSITLCTQLLLDQFLFNKWIFRRFIFKQSKQI